MASGAVRYKLVALLLLIYCLILLPMFEWFVYLLPFLVVQLTRRRERERADCFTLFVLLLSCDSYCSVSLPGGVMCWSVISALMCGSRNFRQMCFRRLLCVRIEIDQL